MQRRHCGDKAFAICTVLGSALLRLPHQNEGFINVLQVHTDTVDILHVVLVMLAACTCEQCRCIAAHITLLGINESGEPLKVFLYSSFVAKASKMYFILC